MIKYKLLTLALIWGCSWTSDTAVIFAFQNSEPQSIQELSVTLSPDTIALHSQYVKDSIRFFVAADAHLAINDSHGDDFYCYSDRMAQDLGDPRSFSSMFQHAKSQNIDAMVLAGDILSFPSEAEGRCLL